MTKLATLKQRLMENCEVRGEYEQADADYTLIEGMIRARTEVHLAQSQLSPKVGVTQSARHKSQAG
ncbi:transcriptional regulator [Acetobacter sacchari]|uniref:Transcriptional regulator n=1 Tax=Acetobacter sacchari TaxID=2661687 RepID=A0ABS3LWM1_9PROT|nr:transcriptional regulator [Acetobacter sacchari]MBO1360307.1 transcriptional regulator [Acetobacter sacchari]